MSEPIFTADSIGRRFGARQVLSSATLWASPGRITALLGRNGCGKTTLLRVGAGLLRADSGAVHFAGRCWLRPSLARLAHHGLFFLPADSLLPWTRAVGEALRWMAHACGRERGMEEVIAGLRLEPLLDRHCYQLSGGERRRTELATVLIRQPRCLLADEPFQGLAPVDAELIATALRRLATAGCAIAVTGHELRSLLPMADDVIWMTAGTTHVLGPPDRALAHDQFRREYLGPGALPA